MSGWRWPAAAVLLVVTSLAVRVSLLQREAWAEAVAHEKAGQLDDAIDGYRRVLRFYTPWGATDDAAAALLELDARARADHPERSVLALDALRSGLIASRSLWQPRADLVARCNRELPPLLVRVAERTGDKRDPKVLLAQFQRDYERPVGVGPLASAAVSLGFLCWLGCLVQIARRGVDDDGRWQPAGWRWAGGALAGFAAWTLAMWWA